MGRGEGDLDALLAPSERGNAPARLRRREFALTMERLRENRSPGVLREAVSVAGSDPESRAELTRWSWERCWERSGIWLSDCRVPFPEPSRSEKELWSREIERVLWGSEPWWFGGSVGEWLVLQIAQNPPTELAEISQPGPVVAAAAAYEVRAHTRSGAPPRFGPLTQRVLWSEEWADAPAAREIREDLVRHFTQDVFQSVDAMQTRATLGLQAPELYPEALERAARYHQILGAPSKPTAQALQQRAQRAFREALADSLTEAMEGSAVEPRIEWLIDPSESPGSMKRQKWHRHRREGRAVADAYAPSQLARALCDPRAIELLSRQLAENAGLKKQWARAHRSLCRWLKEHKEEFADG